MTTEQARRAIVLLSLGTTVVFVALLVLAPLFVTSLNAPNAYRLVQIILPVFAGYLGSSVAFLFQKNAAVSQVMDETILAYLVYGSFAIFWLIGACVFVYFLVSNFAGGPPGMKVDDLANYVTLLVAFMNITVGALTGYLFGKEPRDIQQQLDKEREEFEKKFKAMAEQKQGEQH